MFKERTAIEADIDYALRMVRSGCAMLEQASRTCGIPLPMLQARIAANDAEASAALERREAQPSRKTSTRQ